MVVQALQISRLVGRQLFERFNERRPDGIGSCDAVAKRPAHISCRVSLSSTELASMMGRSNLGGTALADNPASRSRRSVFSTVLIQFLTQ